MASNVPAQPSVLRAARRHLGRGLRHRHRSPIALRIASLLAAILLVGAVLGVASPYFLTAGNLIQILRVSLELAVVSAGMTMLIVMGGIDVGIGGILAVSAIFIGHAYQAGLPDAAVVPIGLGVGALLGAANGLLCGRLAIPPIIATLGTMHVWLAVLFLVIGGQWLAGLPGSLAPLVNGSLLGVPSSLLVILAVYALCGLMLHGLAFGRHLRAVGCDERAAALSGIRVERVKLLAYAWAGLLAGFAALIYVARLRNVEINIGTTIALEAIAAAVLGGASIRGGVGSLTGTLLGVLFIKMIQNGLVLTGVSSLWERVVIGSLLLAVLVAEGLRRRGGP